MFLMMQMIAMYTWPGFLGRNGISIKVTKTLAPIGGKEVWQTDTQNSFGGENFGRLTIYTEGNQGKTEKLADKI